MSESLKGKAKFKEKVDILRQKKPTELSIGERMLLLRLEKGYTNQEEFAKLLKVSKSTINKYENGESTPDYEIIQEIAKQFKVSYDYLFGYSNSKIREHHDIEQSTGLCTDAIKVLLDIRQKQYLGFTDDGNIVDTLNYLIATIGYFGTKDNPDSYISKKWRSQGSDEIESALDNEPKEQGLMNLIHQYITFELHEPVEYSYSEHTVIIHSSLDEETLANMLILKINKMLSDIRNNKYTRATDLPGKGGASNGKHNQN